MDATTRRRFLWQSTAAGLACCGSTRAADAPPRKLPFVVLTTGLMPICIIASWGAIQKRVKEYMIAFLVLETLMVGTFVALDPDGHRLRVFVPSGS